MNLKANKEGNVGGFGERKEKEKLLNLQYNIKYEKIRHKLEKIMKVYDLYCVVNPTQKNQDC